MFHLSVIIRCPKTYFFIVCVFFVNFVHYFPTNSQYMSTVGDDRRLQLASAQHYRRAHFTEQQASNSCCQNTIAHQQTRRSSTASDVTITDGVLWWERLADLNNSSTISPVKLQWSRRCKYCDIKVHVNGITFLFHTDILLGLNRRTDK